MTRGDKVGYVCEHCGGNDVSHDAWADWDVEAQRWTLRCTFDQAFCHSCDKEVWLEERVIVDAD